MRYAFADCRLDTDAHTLLRDGAPVHVEPQVFDVIRCLAEADGALVSYDALIEAVWGGRIVSDATLAARISAARAALGDTGKAQAVIRTIPRRGVQLAVSVSTDSRARAPPNRSIPAMIRRSATQPRAMALASLGRRSARGRRSFGVGHWLGHLEHDWNSPVWRPLLDRLAAGRRLVRYDPRGTGLSDRALNGAGVEELADDMEAVADAAGLERFPIYAISQSVPVALTLAARRPERVSRMILLNGLVQGSDVLGETGKTETMVGLIESGWGVPGSAFMRAIATIYMPKSTPEELEAIVAMQTLSATPDIAAGIRRIVGGIDVSAALERIECPVLVMACAGDSVQDPAQSKRIARGVRDAEFHLCDSPNHIVVPSDPIWEPCVQAFDRFLSADGDPP